MLLLAALTTSNVSFAAAGETDIASTPIVSTSAAAVKPNIMLLMDTSDSMGYTHMPDEIESVTRPTSVGYKSNQCNVLYYDRNQTYLLPKRADGSFFPTPSFTAARYAGFGDFYVTPDTTTVDLSTRFRAYDSGTLQIGGTADPEQPAYYYLHSGGAPSLDYAAFPCRDTDTGVTRGATNGGTWTKVLVSSTSGIASRLDERQNFAIWYSYYRTRLALTKSAASLAFTPLTDSFRVGFITVQPKANRNDLGIDAVNKYLAISDFNATQRASWFAKLFSQTPFGSSPAREGLARVGRHYAGKFDSINTNMTPDPLQYSCQQNFTIMTTDGYWNNQTETPNTGSLNGGPLQIDGTTQIGQADGDAACPLSNPYCPRPIWDGTAGTTEVVRDASNQYDQLNCGLATKFKSTFKTTQARHYFDASYEKTQRRTRIWNTTTDQDLARTTNVTKRVTRTTQTTDQFVQSTYSETKTRYQVRKSQFQSTQTRTQKWEQSIQNQQSQYQVTRRDTAQDETSVQYQLTKSQTTRTTVQNFEEKRRYTIERRQVIKHQYRVVAKPQGNERYDPAPSCTPSATMSCQTIEVFGPEPVDTDTCVAGQDPSSPFVTTTCTAGAMSTAPATTASCTVGTTKSGAPNHVTTICTDAQLQAPTARQTCTAGTDGSNVRTICTRPAGPNNQVTVGVSSCTPNNGATSPHVITTCTNTPGPNNATTYPNSCTVGTTTDAQFVTSVCSRPTATNYVNRQVASCTAGTRTNNQVVTCSAVNTVFATAVVDPTTCTPSDGVARAVGNVTRTCTKVSAGTGLTFTNVQTCTTGNSGSPSWMQTDCQQPAGTNYNRAISATATCTPQTAGSGNGWRQINCTTPANGNNGTFAVAPGTCSPNAGTSSPFVLVTCAGPTQTMAPTLVLPSTCRPLGDTTGPAPDYIVTRCTRTDIDATNASCTAANSGAPDYIETECSSGTVSSAVQTCTLGTTGPSWNQVTCSKPAGPNNLTNSPVATCTPQTKASGNQWVERTCSTTTTFGPQVVHPTDCAAGTASTSPFDTTTCTTNAVAPYPTATAVASCTPGTDGAFTTTTCTKGGAYNPTPQPSAPCSNGTVTTGAPNHVRTTCVATDVTDYTAGSAACTPTDVVGRKVECTTFQSRASEKLASCSNGTSGGPQPETTTCVRTQLATVDSAPCTSFVDTAAKESVVCTKVPLTAAVEDPSCVPGTLSSAPWTITECASGSGAGRILRVTTTTTTTTSKKSGTVVVGTPVVNTSVGAPVELTSCKAPTDPLVALPSPNPRRPVAPEAPTPPGSCTAWPCVDSTTVDAGSRNSLADVASYYYKTDLRPDNVLWPNNVKPVGSGAEDDRATHQHMTTFVVGLGVSGTLPFRSDYRSTAVTTGSFAGLRSGSVNWPVWPDPAIDYANTDNWNNPKSIDDFWHTAVNGRGTFFSAKDPATVVAGLDGALNAINITVASGAGDAASSFEPTAGNNTAFTTGYQTGSWTGDLKAYPINLTSGSLETTLLWSANDLLDVRVKAACDTRNIYLIRPGGELTSGGGQNMVDFSWNTYACDGAGNPTGTARNGLGTTERQSFENGTMPVQLLSQYPAMTDGTSGTVDQRSLSRGASLVNFLRGQRAGEGFLANTTKYYRTRSGVLGDFVGSQPIYVGAPFARYRDAGYGAFKLAKQSRTPMVYVGGNDGMLHAFVAATGEEKWAVVPQAVMGNLYKLADANYKNNHQFFVDGSPEVSDVFDGTNWRTILVGGLNAGGKSYYALDVTDPAAPKALWEFRAFPGAQCPSSPGAAVGNTSDCNLGLTFGKPVITKIGSTWVVLVTSGYNNINSAANGGDGGGYLYAINAVTGAVVHKIDTGAGVATDPSGLAQIRNFVDDTLVDNTTLRAYGGDLFGNVWRFEFPNPGSPSAQRIGTAKDAANKRQPITTKPEIAENGNAPMVFVGTGKLLGSTDVTDPSVQSIYAIVDPLTPGPVHTDLRGALKPLVMTQTGTGASAVRTIACPTSAGAACNRTTGWVLDLPEAGERVNVDMKLLFGVLVVPSNVPEAASCTVGGHSWFNFFDYKTGTQALGVPVSTYFGETLIAGFNVFKMPAPDNQQGFRIVGVGTDGRRQSTPPIYPPPVPSGKRIAWREIVQ